MDIKIEDIHIGDRVVVKDSWKDNLPGQEDYEAESFEVLLIHSGDGTGGEILLSVSLCGWKIRRGTINLISGQEDRIAMLESSENLFGWWIRVKHIEKVIPGNSSIQSKHQPGVYDPMTSRVKSKEELEQYQKDFNFFFRDLTKPYKAPEDAWAKWS